MTESRLKILTERAGLSRYALAKESGLSYQALRKIEESDEYTTKTSLVAIARALAPHLKQTPGQVLVELTGVNGKEPT